MNTQEPSLDLILEEQITIFDAAKSLFEDPQRVCMPYLSKNVAERGQAKVTPRSVEAKKLAMETCPTVSMYAKLHGRLYFVSIVMASRRLNRDFNAVFRDVFTHLKSENEVDFDRVTLAKAIDAIDRASKSPLARPSRAPR